jgi:CoA:oxalate CoA-transferase
LSDRQWPTSAANAGRPLSGTKVLDLSRVLAGPFCTMLLADLGADVVKVESPGGDETRRWGPPFFEGTATYYYAPNRNKWGIVIDLGTPEGQERLHELIVEADVVVQNFTGDIARRLGVDAEQVHALNPSAVHLTFSGFGPAEPERRGYDLIAQALGGLMSVTGEADGEAVKVGVPIADLTAGLYAFGAISAALAERASTGSGAGRSLHVSLYESILSLLSMQGTAWFLAGRESKRMGTDHPFVVPYGVYHTATNPIVIGVGTDDQFVTLVRAIGRHDLVGDPRFVTNQARLTSRDVLRQEMESVLRTASAEHWAKIFDEQGVPNGIVREVHEALGAPEARSIRSVEHPLLGRISQVMNPIRVDDEILEPYLAPPMLGEHDQEVFPAAPQQARRR